jgi:feruloyl esterase
MKTLLLLVASASATVALGADCENLASLKLENTTIKSAQTVAAGAFTPPAGVRGNYKELPEFCRVEGVIKPAPDSEIQFEVWLPASGWNGKYFGIGNGGFAGSVQYTLLAASVKNGYAASSTDTGHQGSPTKADWALNHYDKIIDYAYRSIHETAEKSKSVIQKYYGGNPKHSYFAGCSNGGRQALLEAQRFPEDYDGIIAGAAANDWTHNIAGFVWDQQALDGAEIPASKMAALENATLNACDANDGVKDGVIDQPDKCHFDPSVLLCKGADSDTCFTAAQVQALRKIYEGPRNSKGPIFPGYLPGAEDGPGGWNRWITGPHADQGEYAKGFFGDMVFSNPDWDYRTFEWNRDMKITDDKFARSFNAVDPNLKAFKDRGGKLLIYHGWSDAAIAPTNAIHYYESVQARMGKQAAAEFVQLYMVPGMQHCGGGPGPNSFGTNPSMLPSDAQHSLTIALDHWVDKGTAPTRIIASKYKTGANPESGIERTRPLCPYPQVARYKGSGSTDDAANFTCAVPDSR